MATVSDLFSDLPVILNSDDYNLYTGKNLEEELEYINLQGVSQFLDRAHENLYYGFIYGSGGKKLKDKLILNNLASLQKPLIMCLIAQVDYMIDAGGDFGSYSGAVTNTSENVEFKTTKELREKQLAPKIYDLLKYAKPALVMELLI